MMRRCYVALGSNIDAARHIVGSVAELRDRFGKVTLSTVYESEAAGFAGEPFLNAVAAFDSTASPDRLSGILRAIEIELAPEAKHPVTQRTYKALWPSCDHPPAADIRTVSLPI